MKIAVDDCLTCIFSAKDNGYKVMNSKIKMLIFSDR